MTPLLLLALWSFFIGVSGRSVLGRTLESPEVGQATCSQLTASWTSTQAASLSGDWSYMYRLKLLPMSEDGPRRLVFPEQPLFRFIRRVYKCCQMGHHCVGVKGLQGRQTAGSSVEFVVSGDMWSAPILRAEVHLHISNPHLLNVWPLLPWLEKRHLPTRYSVLWRDNGMLEVRVDLLFIFQALQARSGKRGGSSVMELWRVGGLRTHQATQTRPTQYPLQVPVELGLALHCSTVKLNTLPCESHGVRLLHTPFITLSYG